MVICCRGQGNVSDPEFANYVINSGPENMCTGCKNRFWFTDNMLCPAGNK
ncbi:MAG TPA: hypothetical protein PK669_10870 [Methanosarcina thermophila]|jgi:hypothetical protein|nr:hypothetical protein [Methanosarcina thermophila]NLU58082.1 hypothetical protein [Methanosarcina thermophila]HOA69649.1 hypothetical protein [Methanosarcina thermophila]HOQ66302.1 hypothetical protein [Methanosarcina thermophila]HPT81471.1 hypothetical protein [Methanosarcina thermophila]HPZ20804.1 hypothetical protein [Methanosarcina thermophila]